MQSNTESEEIAVLCQTHGSPERRNYTQSYIISESFAERIWKCVFLTCDDIMQASRHTFLKIADKITDIQAVLISRDLTPCMLLLVKHLEQCRTFADTMVHRFVRACHSVTALSCCYHPCCFLRKSVISVEVHGSQREVLTGECEKPGVKC